MSGIQATSCYAIAYIPEHRTAQQERGHTASREQKDGIHKRAKRQNLDRCPSHAPYADSLLNFLNQTTVCAVSLLSLLMLESATLT